MSTKQDLFGVGLRTSFYPHLENHQETRLDWFEVISENFMFSRGRPRHVLKQVSEHYPLSFHGVSLNIASHEDLDFVYLSALRALAEEFQPMLISDHLCWTGLSHNNLHNLLPIPYTEALLQHLIGRIEQVQDYLGRTFVLENLSAYLSFEADEYSEWEFLAELTRRTGCQLLLDINNLYVNSQNQGFVAQEFIDAIPSAAIAQYHLAGYSEMEGFLFDTHSRPVYPEVWELYRYTLQTKGIRPTLLEWDDDIPELARVEAEVMKAKQIWTDISDHPPQATPSKIFNPIAPEFKQAIDNKPSEQFALETFQQIFVNSIQSGTEPNKLFIKLFKDTPALTVNNALLTYRNDYTARLTDALADTFAATEFVLGSGLFKQLANDFLKSHVSRHPDLGAFGHELPYFVRTHRLCSDYPYLPDLCQLERCFHTFFHAAPQKSSDWSLMESHPEPEQLFFQLIASAHIFVSDYPLFDLWTWKKAPEQILDIYQGKKEYLLLFKNKLGVRSHRLNQNQYQLLTTLMTGHSLGTALNELPESATEDVAALFTLLRHEDLILKITV